MRTDWTDNTLFTKTTINAIHARFANETALTFLARSAIIAAVTSISSHTVQTNRTRCATITLVIKIRF
jgi:hypothetical protein